ncbi:MAG: hypothetical protein ACLFPN_02835 [Methanomassiliicoccales archaeon]
MKIIGVMTEDFRHFHRLVQSLKGRGQPFVSLGFGDPVPPSVGVIITTEAERDRVDFPRVVAEAEAEAAIDLALTVLRGGERFQRVVMGIDPGIRPGMAVLADGKLVLERIVRTPEEVAQEISRFVAHVEFSTLLVRIGHGDPTNRDRTIRAIWDLVENIEVVDETSTTVQDSVPDLRAARSIAQTRGEPVVRKPQVSPKTGEIRNIQRLSRVESAGRVTISYHLAEAVAKGEMTLREALRRQGSA